MSRIKTKKASSFFHKGKEIVIRELEEKPALNQVQQDHIDGKLNIYEPIKTYQEKWVTKFKRVGFWEYYDHAYPVAGTRRRADLPPVYSQWKEDFVNRCLPTIRNSMNCSKP